MNHGRCFLSVVHLTCLNPISFVYSDFLSVKDNQIWKFLNDVQSILGLSCHWVVVKRYLHQVNKFSKPINFPELSQSIASTMECLESLKALNVCQTSQTIVFELKA